MEEFNFEAPLHVDLENLSVEYEEQVSTYFEIDHESNAEPSEYNGIALNPLAGDEEEETYMHYYTPNPEKFQYGALRKSMSMSSLPQGIRHIEQSNDILSSENCDKLETHEQNKRNNKIGKIKHQSTSSSNLTRLQSKDLHKADVYTSMAESIDKFHLRTPTRFHSKPKNAALELVRFESATATIPQSPNLRTKARSRPVVTMTKEEREVADFEEARKHKIKAHPVNYKALQGEKMHAVEKKPVTKVEPFNITEATKKMPPSPQQTYEFHSKPVPKSLYNPPKPVIKSSLLAQPITTQALRKRMQKPAVENKPQAVQLKKKPTIPLPFTFEERDQRLLRKKEQFVQKVLEEEKKMREVHARPLPKSLYKPPTILPKPLVKSKSNNNLRSSSESLKSNKSWDNASLPGQTSAGFKSRPATVLYIPPFVPKKQERPVIQVTEFELNTQNRAKERIVFEEKKKERLEQFDKMRKEREEELRHAELQEIASLRKQAQHVACPIRQYKDVKPFSPKQVTIPISPKFLTTNLRNKENKEPLQL